MITGTHAILYSDHAEEVRAFFRDILKFPSVDAGHGWLIFALPPAELGIHPTEQGGRHELYLMCDDVKSTVADLESRGVEFSRPITEAGFGLLTSIVLPGGAELGLYQPKHPLGRRRTRIEIALRPGPRRPVNHGTKSAGAKPPNDRRPNSL